MINFNWKGTLFVLGIAIICVGMLVVFTMSAGCVTAAKNIYTELKKTPTPTPTPIPTPVPVIPTPRLTPLALPTIKPQPVNLFFPGERYEGQWYQWKRMNVSGLKDLHAGILVYRHAWLNSYHWYNTALGNYMVQKPGKGMRYFVVWVHQESLGKDDPGFFPFYEDAFQLQINNTLYKADTVHNPICTIGEFNNKYDYYNMVIAPPFGYFIHLVGNNPETGGYVAERLGEVRYGQGNSIDGYILYEVPEKTMIEDVSLLGSFGTFGSAWWKFTE
jgi:hypothetical protein